MKLYKNLVNEVALTLQQIFIQNRFADKALERTLKSHPQWGSRDRRFVAEAVYDIVRNFRLYASIAGNEKNFWFITAVWMVNKGFEIPDWQEFRHLNPQQVLEDKKHLEQEPVYRYSYPDWLWKLGQEELGEERWAKEAEALHGQAEVFLRTNTLKASRQKLAESFAPGEQKLSEVEATPEALLLQKRENVFQHKLFKDGWFEVQDAGSQQIAHYLQVKPGQVVIDACAGVGGKSLHLAALMQNKGRIISLDVEEFKLVELKRRARRGGVHMIETRNVSDHNVITSLAGKADRLLLDVPCSGLGVLKRNPDAKWKLTEEVIKRTRELQAQILEDYAVMVKPGGYMVYSTCSILPSENQKQVEKFLSGNRTFKLDAEKTLWPSEGFDGFYMARLIREE